ncbi:transcription factor Tfb2-domain-containing protein, partial [Paraphysoderma sedebokerense]
YLEQLPQQTFTRLFNQPSTCLAVYRLLPSLAKQIIMRLLYIQHPISESDLSSWCYKEHLLKQKESLLKLKKLYILFAKNGFWHLNETFRVGFRNALTGSGNHNSFGLLAHTSAKTNIEVDIPFLDRYATEQWESILHYMVGTSVKRPPNAVLNLLQRSGLMAVDIEKMKISSKGFQFLLQDVNTQVWALLLQYIEMAGDLHMDLVEVLNFFFQLSSLELGCAYSVETLTETQLIMLEDLRAFGIVYQRKKKSKKYYPTRLATTLTTGGSATLTTSVQSVAADPGRSEDKEKGFILLETNYRLYAYTDSPLQIAILSLFSHMKARFPNMVMAILTRDSVHNALKSGISADQIVSYLYAHAHPNMRKQNPVLPLTVVDQIRLWEVERNRLKFNEGYLYSQFLKQSDFEITLDYAQKINVIKWFDKKKRMFVVSDEGHSSVKEFIKRRMEAKKAEKMEREKTK